MSGIAMEQGEPIGGEDGDVLHLHAYQDQPGAWDEMLDADGTVRPHWRHLTETMAQLGLPALHDRSREARRLLRETGATYNVYGDPQGYERPWPLDPIPALISSDEWLEIETALVQRAELLDLILRDVYGPQDLLRHGLLPPELVYGHPGFLRPCHPLRAPARHALVLYAVDLARGPDGQMRVLSDRTQAPSGSGYALANRLVMSRVLPSLYRDSHVHRLSLFFQNVRASLAALSPRRQAEPRVVLLTPGPMNEAYFEHTYLASYLGYTLARGADLTVRDGQVWLRAMRRLEPVDVILRRIDDHYCDPLELYPESQLGIPGLTEAVRRGTVAVANPLGSSVLEDPGLNTFLPTIARHFFGQDLLLPSVPTWWCGDARHREHVLANLDRMVIRRTARRPGGLPVFGAEISRAEREAVARQVRAEPASFVGQEALRFSSVPALVPSGVERRQAVIRTFLVARDDGYVVMPGALTRIGASLGSVLISNQAGSLSKDTWILATEPEKQTTLLTGTPRVPVAREARSGLPGGAADNLFWLGRYAERTEQAIRIVRTALRVYRDAVEFQAPDGTCLDDLLGAVTLVTGTAPGFLGEEGAMQRAAPIAEILSVALDPTRPGSVCFDLNATLAAAYAVRDRLSGDAWRVVNDVRTRLERFQARSREVVDGLEDDLDAFITDLVAVFALAQDTMLRGQGWLFLDAGRRVERALLLVALLRSMVVARRDEAVEPQNLEAVLRATESLMAYQRAYHDRPRIDAVLALLLLDETNPRSLAFQLGEVQRAIAALAHDDARVELAEEERLVLDAATSLRLADLTALAGYADGGGRRELDVLLERIGSLLRRTSDVLTRNYFIEVRGPQQLAAASEGVR
jgi:uncharacterized circularly permuted ATP-grasp superfamily protein/uncharacterized alpha-E superfamily protein